MAFYDLVGQVIALLQGEVYGWLREAFDTPALEAKALLGALR